MINRRREAIEAKIAEHKALMESAEHQLRDWNTPGHRKPRIRNEIRYRRAEIAKLHGQLAEEAEK